MLLFVDVETTGLSQKEDRLVQIAWIVANRRGDVLKQSDFIIRPDDFYIPYSATSIHGITNDRAKSEGVPLRSALLKFAKDAEKAEFIVGHNINFDISFISADFKRENIELNNIKLPQICTMRLSTQYCRIPKFNGKKGFKWPNLSELHHHLFNEGFDGAHNAVADIHATMRCFFKLVELNEIVLPPSLVSSETKASPAWTSPVTAKPKNRRSDEPKRLSQAPAKLLACRHCKKTNRIPAHKNSDEAICGECGINLKNINDSDKSSNASKVNFLEKDIEELIKRLISYGLTPQKIGSKWRVLDKIYIPYELYSFEREFVKKISETEQESTALNINDDRKISFEKSISDDFEKLIERLISYGLEPEKIGSKWQVQGKLYVPHELYEFERYYRDYREKVNSGYHFGSAPQAGGGAEIPSKSETRDQEIETKLTENRKISFEKSTSGDFEKLIERLISYGLKPEKIGSNWRVQGRLYIPHELYDFERFYQEYREKVSSGYYFGSASQALGGAEFLSKSQELDQEIEAKLTAHGFQIEKTSSNWKVDGQIYLPHELSQFEQKCTPRRLKAVERAPYVTELLRQHGFSVQKSWSNWLINGKLLSPEQMVQLEQKCTPQRAAAVKSQRAGAVKRAPAIAEILRKHGVSVESKSSNWLVDGSLLSPEELVRLNPDNVAMRLRDKGYSVLKIGLRWKLEGEVISTKNLIEFEKNDE